MADGVQLLERVRRPCTRGRREDVGQPGAVAGQGEEEVEVEVRPLGHQAPQPLVEQVVAEEDHRVQARGRLPHRVGREADLRQVRDVHLDLDHGPSLEPKDGRQEGSARAERSGPRRRVDSLAGMRAIQVVEPTGPEHLELREVAEPTPGPDDVLVEVHAVGVSFPDLLLSRGEYQLKPEPPFTLGVDFAGTVVSGPGFEPGQRVAGRRRLGRRGRAGRQPRRLHLPAARRAVASTRARPCR